MIFEFDSLIEFVKYYNFFYKDEPDKKMEDILDMSKKVRNALKEKIWNRTSVRDFNFIFIYLEFFFK